MAIDDVKVAELRKEFPEDVVGKKPKGGVDLDFVGHAAVTARLLNVDPEWNWEPFAVDERGLPALDGKGNLWIRLTVCGHTRIGVGDGPSIKECIGDAIRNAAMRFGVALYLWSKDEIEGGPAKPTRKKAATRAPEATTRMSRPQRDKTPRDTEEGRMWALFTENGYDTKTEKDRMLAFISGVVERNVTSRTDLTDAELADVITELQVQKGNQ